MPRLSVSVDSVVFEHLSSRATVERRSVSAMAALLIEEGLGGEERPTSGGATAPSPPEVYEPFEDSP